MGHSGATKTERSGITKLKSEMKQVRGFHQCSSESTAVLELYYVRFYSCWITEISKVALILKLITKWKIVKGCFLQKCSSSFVLVSHAACGRTWTNCNAFMACTVKTVLLSCLAKEKPHVQREAFIQCLFLYLTQIAKLDHIPFGKDTRGKGILFCFVPVLSLQEWWMITARTYTYTCSSSIVQINFSWVYGEITENTTKMLWMNVIDGFLMSGWVSLFCDCISNFLLL